jgi:Protein of unknown function (DUF3224)
VGGARFLTDRGRYQLRKRSHIAHPLVLAALITGLALSGVQVASAATSGRVKGTITVLSNKVESTAKIGATTETVATAHVAYSGGLVGTATEDYDSVTQANGKVNLQGAGFFQGSVNGRAGSLRYVFRGDGGGGVIVIVHATGGLARMQGRITYVALGGADYSYGGLLRRAG